uniref:Reverse transcriptase domain-containing protein n=1 Tax=Tanacetum cinerariifolium TaxID=118510 RepID=A0A6L2NEZ0_TANCI|nr:hypothetical protein [Tanacetum cinerariifolium]
MFDSRDFLSPEEISPKDTETSESPTPSIFAELDNSLWIIPRPMGGESDTGEPNESDAYDHLWKMPPKMTSTSEAPAMTQDDIKKLVADSVFEALKAQAANMANTDNTTRPRETHVARKCTYKEFMSCQPFYFNDTEGVVGLIHWFERTESGFAVVLAVLKPERLKADKARMYEEASKVESCPSEIILDDLLALDSIVRFDFE